MAEPKDKDKVKKEDKKEKKNKSNEQAKEKPKASKQLEDAIEPIPAALENILGTAPHWVVFKFSKDFDPLVYLHKGRIRLDDPPELRSHKSATQQLGMRVERGGPCKHWLPMRPKDPTQPFLMPAGSVSSCIRLGKILPGKGEIGQKSGTDIGFLKVEVYEKEIGSSVPLGFWPLNPVSSWWTKEELTKLNFHRKQAQKNRYRTLEGKNPLFENMTFSGHSTQKTNDYEVVYLGAVMPERHRLLLFPAELYELRSCISKRTGRIDEFEAVGATEDANDVTEEDTRTYNEKATDLVNSFSVAKKKRAREAYAQNQLLDSGEIGAKEAKALAEMAQEKKAETTIGAPTNYRQQQLEQMRKVLPEFDEEATDPDNVYKKGLARIAPAKNMQEVKMPLTEKLQDMIDGGDSTQNMEQEERLAICKGSRTVESLLCSYIDARAKAEKKRLKAERKAEKQKEKRKKPAEDDAMTPESELAKVMGPEGQSDPFEKLKSPKDFAHQLALLRGLIRVHTDIRGGRDYNHGKMLGLVEACITGRKPKPKSSTGETADITGEQTQVAEEEMKAGLEGEPECPENFPEQKQMARRWADLFFDVSGGSRMLNRKRVLTHICIYTASLAPSFPEFDFTGIAADLNMKASELRENLKSMGFRPPSSGRGSHILTLELHAPIELPVDKLKGEEDAEDKGDAKGGNALNVKGAKRRKKG
eukprot:gnl/MRDRNA2_/MRDRNA2_28785_c0_seq1.p1 gnl/MRDRNA2_/MRDRNA2_28785_c0~~gnl/MRDRNA2_/MRDRNA2_28785_c0_seq1.p1  ORF type:complete len:702 (+),score=175.28 gnl/MRDRNA2_/MRDRNA2_28785_c0_seq1:35-2140(+)